MTPEEIKRVREERLPHLDKDLCLTCGNLVMTDIGGGPCDVGHVTVHQKLCAAGCGSILGLRSDGESGEVYCESCLSKVRPVSIDPSQRPKQHDERRCVLVHPTKEFYVYEIRGVVLLSWCSKQDVHFAARFPHDGIEQMAATLSGVAGVELLYEVIGEDVLV